GQVLVTGARGPALHARIRCELAFGAEPEPSAELSGVGEGAPDAGHRCLQDDLLLDAVGGRDHGWVSVVCGWNGCELRANAQPTGCILARAARHATGKLPVLRAGLAASS